MSTRDYRKFLQADGRLNVRLIPRPVYLQMLARHKADPNVIDEVFTPLHWKWDLDHRIRSAAKEGLSLTPAESAASILADMDDREWWTTTEAFEEHLIRSFAATTDSWSDLLDPIYDRQDLEGWKDLHYSKFLEDPSTTKDNPR